MKNVITLIVVLIAFTSCSKAQDVVPGSQQWVTVTASCSQCSLDIDQQGQLKTIHFGGWVSYTYQNTTGQETASAKIYVSAKDTRSQELYIQIKESRFGNSAEKRHVIRSFVQQDFPIWDEIKLDLKRKH